MQGKQWKEAGTLPPIKGWAKRTRLEVVSDEEVIVIDNKRLFVTDHPGIAWMPEKGAGRDALLMRGTHLDVSSSTVVENNVAHTLNVRGAVAKPEHLYKTTVYNIEVEDFHTYYVGEAGVWVHNKNIFVKPGVGADQ